MKSIPTYKPVDNIAVMRICVLIIVVVPFLGTLLAIRLLWQYAVNWSDLVLLAVIYCVTLPGVTIGYHRMLTHRSFRANPVVKALFLILGSMSAQGPAIDWAASHIKHHALADQEGDPHSPLDGFFHAHVGWHNNHHAFPRSAFHGLHWWQFDLCGYLIWILERLGLVHDVYRVPQALLERRSFARTSTVSAKPEGKQ